MNVIREFSDYNYIIVANVIRKDDNGEIVSTARLQVGRADSKSEAKKEIDRITMVSNLIHTGFSGDEVVYNTYKRATQPLSAIVNGQTISEEISHFDIIHKEEYFKPC